MTSDTNVQLFSYGTLRLERVQLTNFGRLLKGSSDAVKGYRTDLIEITDPDVIRESGTNFHPIVTPTGDESDSVAGTVFEITASELAAADEYEVAAYKRVNVELQSGIKAWMYVKA